MTPWPRYRGNAGTLCSRKSIAFSVPEVALNSSTTSSAFRLSARRLPPAAPSRHQQKNLIRMPMSLVQHRPKSPQGARRHPNPGNVPMKIGKRKRVTVTMLRDCTSTCSHSSTVSIRYPAPSSWIPSGGDSATRAFSRFSTPTFAFHRGSS